MTTSYRWFRAGDLNGFFALMFDNVANLVILASVLIRAFGFPADIVLYRMVPGTAIGVLAGDLFYAWMAGRLARQTNRNDVTAMPLGLNAPSIVGMSFGVLGPAYLATHDPWLAWKMGIAVTVLVGILKIALSFFGNTVRRVVPRAALLGSIGGGTTRWSRRDRLGQQPFSHSRYGAQRLSLDGRLLPGPVSVGNIFQLYE
jgi:AGZA family xanthine/uracil permease-like MFS transporter